MVHRKVIDNYNRERMRSLLYSNYYNDDFGIHEMPLMSTFLAPSSFTSKQGQALGEVSLWPLMVFLCFKNKWLKHKKKQFWARKWKKKPKRDLQIGFSYHHINTYIIAFFLNYNWVHVWILSINKFTYNRKRRFYFQRWNECKLLI